jgi:hypothetical protein
MASPLVHKKRNGRIVVHDTQGDDRYKQRHAKPEAPITMRTGLSNAERARQDPIWFRSSSRLPAATASTEPGLSVSVRVTSRGYLWSGGQGQILGYDADRRSDDLA